jgi:hypothetical protein
MEPRKLKRLEDFPQFIVTGVRRGATSDAGYTRFELDGSFDRVGETLDPSWFWLLFGEREYLCASLKSFDNETKAAILTCEEASEPKVVGRALAYLSRYWQAFHVWMVLDPRWTWERKQLRGTDAVAEDYESKDVAIVEGREVRVWTKMEPVEGRGGRVDTTQQPTKLCPSAPVLGWFHLGGVTSTANCVMLTSTRGNSDTVILEPVGCARSVTGDMW